jgi:hypothetical protein
MDLIRIRFVVIFFIAALSSCGFNLKHQVKPVDGQQISNLPAGNKPVVFLDYGFYGRKKAYEESENPVKYRVSQAEATYIHSLVTQTGLFQNVIFDEYKKDNADYTLAIEIFTEVDPSILGPILTGLTLGLIPSSMESESEVRIRLIDKDNKVVESVSNKDGQTFWIGLFAPLFTEVSYDPTRQTVYNQVKDGMLKLSQSSIFK